MDCVRYDMFTQQLDAGELPFLSSVQDEFLRFTKAVAPGSWTIPSHASLFTGLYPWDHGAHYKTGAILNGTPPTLAEYLRARGYRTACYSANGYVQPDTGLTRGFEKVLWGGDREFFLRVLARNASCPSLNGKDAAIVAILDQAPTASSARVAGMRALSRFSPLCDALNRIGGKLVGSPPSHVASWIEREFDAGLNEFDGEPIFFFVNLLEAHEPYLADAGLPIGLADWLSYAGTTQVSEQWKRGEREPSEKDLAWSRRGYRSSMKVIDERVRTLVGHLKAHGRWENTLLVLTSDHGQAFGEGGSMYHRLNLQEAITRVPLWLKPGPTDGARPGLSDRAWVSLTDIPTTVAAALDPSATFGDPGSIRLAAADRSVGRTVYSMTDGLSRNEAKGLPAARREQLDRVQIAGYRGEFKQIVDQSGAHYDLHVVGTEARPVGPADTGFDPSAFGEIPARVRTVLTLPEPTSVSQRIAGWGY